MSFVVHNRLSRARGGSVVVLEARERIGGRIFTHRDRETPVPIELGAEFIHGSAEALNELLHDARLTGVDVAGQRYFVAGPKLRPLNDFWEQLDRVMRRLPQAPAQDRSFVNSWIRVWAGGGSRVSAVSRCSGSRGFTPQIRAWQASTHWPMAAGRPTISRSGSWVV